MNMQELITAAYHKLPIKFFIINNSFLGMVRQWQELFHAEKYSFTDLSDSNPDFVKVGEAFGCKAYSTDKPENVDDLLDEALAYNKGPVLIEFKVVKEDMVFPIIPAGKSVKEIMTKRLDPKEMV
jgi:acetolactate synthase-1/2/3 large subunit